jgi:hypothetical protein
MKRFLLTIVFGAFLLAFSPVQAQKVIEKKADLKANQRVVLDLQQASAIRIRGGNGKQLQVRANVTINQGKLNDALLLNLDSKGDDVVVKSAFDEALIRTGQATDCPDNAGFSMWIDSGDKGRGGYRICTNIEYDVELPAGASVRVNTISGNIEVTGLNGPLDAKSISGFVDVSWPISKGADVALKTITGEVYTDQEVAFGNKQNNSPVGYQLRGALGKGGPNIQLESVSGDVFFRKQK